MTIRNQPPNLSSIKELDDITDLLGGKVSQAFKQLVTSRARDSHDVVRRVQVLNQFSQIAKTSTLEAALNWSKSGAPWIAAAYYQAKQQADAAEKSKAKE